MTGDFNCDQTLWEATRRAHAAARSTFEVSRHGSVWKRGGTIERVAQFESEEKAMQILQAAGYKQTGNTFRP